MDAYEVIEIIRTININLKFYIEKYDIWIYMILFTIVYAKTAFVVTTFLPGDTLVFTSATLAAMGYLNIWLLLIGFFFATIVGDNQNFLIGRMIDAIPKKHSLLKRSLPSTIVDKEKAFLEKYGYIAITFSRFIPLMRTMMPFTSGYIHYSYRNFAVFNIAGATLWSLVWSGTGYILGNIPWVGENLVITLVLISATAITPSIIEFGRRKKKAEHKQREAG